MSELRNYLWLIPALPLAAAVLIAFLGPRLLKERSHWLALLASAASCVLSVLVLLAVWNATSHAAPEGEHPVGMGPEAAHVAQAEHRLDSAGARVGQRRLEREPVAVDAAQHRGSDRARRGERRDHARHLPTRAHDGLPASATRRGRNHRLSAGTSALAIKIA